MTDLAPPPPASSPTPSDRAAYADPLATARPPASRPRNRRRGGIAIAMAAALALSAGARFWADALREKALPRRGEQAVSNTSLSSMNSFALGLLLGGLRGPLVMILWTDSENQKTARNLEGVDTEIEWIRLLQPEFDTVHLFQIWNKAYNISVQMASVANKYDVILGALDYAHNVDGQKPDDINIVGTIGQLYFDKFGTSSEKWYYRGRVRAESKPHRTDAAARRRDVGWRRTSLDPVLDADGNVLPAEARGDLPFLAKYQPYADGISTFGFAYNYYMRSDELLIKAFQHHDQISDVVIDSRPALSLKNWADDELIQGRHREAQAFGTDFVDEQADPDAVTGDLAVDARVVDAGMAALALDAYGRTARLGPDSIAEYRRHIKNYPDRQSQYQLYMDEMVAEPLLATADAAYLRAVMATDPAARRTRLEQAAAGYLAAQVAYDYVLLRYYTDGRVLARALPPGFAPLPTGGQQPLEAMSPEQTLAAENAAEHGYQPFGPFRDDSGDRAEYLIHVARADHRRSLIAAALGRSPAATRP